ncbi:MAG TPA: DegT/DnrJ/EryC1/StrS family aminotransferase [Gemmatimonadales bacterium]|nr:DegT/DnrJ/EryC1/StrS family aminotransferase [Gemmatimonadales bacterium]
MTVTARASGATGVRSAAPLGAAGPGWRHQPPVASPMTVSACRAGLSAAASPARAMRARRELEALLAARFAPAAMRLLDSGTTALALAIRAAAGDRAGVPVALPAFACYDVATAADAADLPVFLYDLDPGTLTPDLESLRRALRAGAKAVVIAHLYGHPANLSEISALAADAGAVVIEDAAQGAGATVRGRPAGSQASLGVLSFGRGKGWTGGAGGALLGMDAAGLRALDSVPPLAADAPRGFRAVAAAGAQLLLARPAWYALPAALPFLRLGQTVYRRPRPPQPISGASCALLCGTAPLADAEIRIRRRNAERLLDEVARRGCFEAPAAAPGVEPGYLRLPLILSSDARAEAVTRAAARLGIAPSYPRALCDLRAFASRCRNRHEGFLGARLLAARLCTLPTHGGLDEGDLASLTEWIRTVSPCC